MDGEDTWSPVRVLLLVREIFRLQIPMKPEGEVPDEGKDQPGDHTADDQHHQVLQEVPLSDSANRVSEKMAVLERNLNIHASIFLNNSLDTIGRHYLQLCSDRFSKISIYLHFKTSNCL
jgi:hypothetical protein